jgi:hypothetical protein
MDDLERIKQHHGGPHLDGSSPHRPYWKRAHRSPFFWIAAFMMLLAMYIFVTTDSFGLRPHTAAGTSSRAIVP